MTLGAFKLACAAHRFLGQHQGAEQQPEAAPGPPPKTEIQPHSQTVFGSSSFYAGRERGTKLSQSRVLTEREMEMIELGGASP